MPRGLYLSKTLFEGLIFGGAYIRRGLCTEGNLRFKIGWATLQWKGNLPFLLCFTLYSGANSKYKPPGGLFSEGRFNGGFFALRFWGAYIWRGLYMEGLIFGILRYYETMDIAVCCFKNYNIRSTPKQRFGVTDLE